MGGCPELDLCQCHWLLLLTDCGGAGSKGCGDGIILAMRLFGWQVVYGLQGNLVSMKICAMLPILLLEVCLSHSVHSCNMLWYSPSALLVEVGKAVVLLDAAVASAMCHQLLLSLSCNICSSMLIVVGRSNGCVVIVMLPT